MKKLQRELRVLKQNGILNKEFRADMREIHDLRKISRVHTSMHTA